MRRGLPAEPLARLVAIVARLRGEPGCPWDKAQNLENLLYHLGCEYREVVEAVRSGAPEALKEELGDLLYNVVFMARVAEERGWFTLADVARAVGEKLLHRHPHVFEDPRPVSLEEAGRLWRERKAQEKDSR